jgi:hypothetical protein
VRSSVGHLRTVSTAAVTEEMRRAGEARRAGRYKAPRSRSRLGARGTAIGGRPLEELRPRQLELRVAALVQLHPPSHHHSPRPAAGGWRPLAARLALSITYNPLRCLHLNPKLDLNTTKRDWRGWGGLSAINPPPAQAHFPEKAPRGAGAPPGSTPSPSPARRASGGGLKKLHTKAQSQETRAGANFLGGYEEH